ncbi:MAG: dipeptidase [Saprospiraceae bacterium]|nr:dipeptidase [Saprospiraceae bacterium]
MKKQILLHLSILMLLTSVSAQNVKIKPKHLAKANALAQKYVIVDAHVDVPYRLKAKMEDVSVRTPKGDFDYVRAKQGGLTAPFMSIYVPSSFQNQKGAAKAYADTLIDIVEGLVKKNPEKFALAYSPDQVEANFKKGLISLPMGMENGAPIEDNLENVAHFHKRGVRYITLTHAEDNLICASSYSLNNKWNGLSAFGKQVVEEMNRVGIMIDVSHVSDKTIEQVLEISKAPVIASHSSCRKYTPTLMRNLPDELIKAIAAKGGVIHINFSSLFLDNASAEAFLKERQDKREWLLKNNTTTKDPRYAVFEEEYDRTHPAPFSTLNRLADHIDHIKKLVGVDYIGFGSDFDGAGDTFPEGIKDVSMYPNLIAVLLKRGYTEGDIEKICFKNTFRVWREVERVSQKK